MTTGQANYELITKCRFCECDKLNTLFDFGLCAHANSYLTKEDLNLIKKKEKEEVKSPLVVVQCQHCGCTQLNANVNPEVLYSNYLYESSTSSTLRKHFEDYATEIRNTFKPGSDDLIIDLGSNDNVLLKPFKDLGYKNLLGVEPAKNIVDKVKDQGIPIINKFFNEAVAFFILAKYGYASIITCNNALAHNHDLSPIIKGVKDILKPDGIFIVECAYLLDSIKGGHWSQIYSEHTYMNSLKPLCQYLNRFGLSIFDVGFNSIQGGTLKLYICHTGASMIQESVEKGIKAEEDFGLYDITTYIAMNEKIKEDKKKFQKLIKKIKKEKKKLAVYSWPAKLSTWSKVMGVKKKDFVFAVEDGSLKQGKFSPDSHVEIVSKEEFYKKAPDYCLIGSYNIEKEIMEKNIDFQGKWIKISDLEIV